MLRMLGQNLSKLGRGFHLGVNIRAAPGQFRKVDFMTGSSLRFGYDLSAAGTGGSDGEGNSKRSMDAVGC